MRNIVQQALNIGRSTQTFGKRFWQAAAMISLLVFISVTQYERLNLVLYDTLLEHFNIEQTNHVTLVDIDDKSIEILGEWPWDRDIHAQLLATIESLAPAAIGFDVLFPSKPINGGNRDVEFANAISNAGNVILPISPKLQESSNSPELLPQANLAASALALGHVDFKIDADGSVRETFLYAGYQQPRWPSFALAIANAVKPIGANQYNISGVTPSDQWVRAHPVKINYSLVKGDTRLPHVSYIDLLEGNVPRNLIQDKALIIGMNATALGDRFSTPLNHIPYNLTGAEINAHLVNTLLNNTSIKDYSALTFVFISILLLAFSLMFYFRLPSMKLQYWFLIQVVVLISFTYFSFVLFNYWYPPIMSFTLLLMTFAFLATYETFKQDIQFATLNKQLLYDELTGFHNEVGLHAELEKCITNERPLAIIAINVARFNAIAELFDVDTQDFALQEIATHIQSLSKDSILQARTYNANFILVVNRNSQDELNRFAESIMNTLIKPISINQATFTLACNIGISEFPTDGTNSKELISAAQSASSRAKSTVGNSICYYDKDVRQQLKLRAELEQDIWQAINNDELELHYQPQVVSDTGKIAGAEALIRWRHPNKGLISPADFIPIAEDTGAIIDIGQWVLNQACMTAKQWQISGHPDFRIAVNVSSKQFAEPNLIEHVKLALTKSELEPKYLELELTESCVVEDYNKAVITLKELKAIGVELSIDDFGTGYSSLSYLKHFPMDRLKIDRSFITELGNDDSSNNLTKAIITMAHSLNLKVIAEGIETDSQRDFLHEHKVEELQGFLFGKPISENQMEQLLNNGDLDGQNN